MRRRACLILIAMLCGCVGRESLSQQQQASAGPTSSASATAPVTVAAGDPQVIEAEGCYNNEPAPAQYQPFSCQLKQPVPAGDGVKVIYWTNADTTLSTNTVTVSDPSQTSYLPVVSVPRAGSTNDMIWIASGVASTASPSLVVTVNPGNTAPTSPTTPEITIRAIVVVHTFGGNSFKDVVSSGCVAPPTSAPGPCLPILGPSLSPAVNDLVFVVGLSDQPIFNANSISSPWALAWTSSDVGTGLGYFVVGYVANTASRLQPGLAISQSQLNTNFGWTWTAVEASFD